MGRRIPEEAPIAKRNKWCFAPHQQRAMESVRLLRESRFTNKPCHSASKLCLKAAQNLMCPSPEAQAKGCLHLWGMGRYGDGRCRGKLCGAGGMGHPAGLLKRGGNCISIPKFGINIFQVPLETVALQPLPQLHSALDTVERKYDSDTMEIIKARSNTSEREAERNPTDMH